MAPSRTRPRACHGCREQKIRCDLAQDGLDEACSRCRRMGLECLKLSPMKRNRNTKAALQRELDDLKQQLSHSQMNTLPNGQLQTSWEGQDEESDVLPLRPLPSMSLPLPNSTLSAPDSSDGERASAGPTTFSTEDTASPTESLTSPRTLGSREYDAQRIDDCFDLYHSFYHPVLPILDSVGSPNDYYNLSPFLFWTILATGCRRYSEDPTMIESIGPLINGMAFASMASPLAPIQTLQGLLILCTWATPLTSLTKDMTYVACGAAIHLAMQLGLHIPGVGQDFAPNQLHSDVGQLTFRDRLWSLTCIVCQLTSQSLGLPASVATDFVDMDLRDNSRLSDEIQFYASLSRVQGRALTAFMRQVQFDTALSPDQTPQVGALHALVKSYDAELGGFVSSLTGERRILHFQCSRLHVNSFLFFATNDTQTLDHDSLIDLYDTAYKVIMGTKSTYSHRPSCPDYGYRSLLLAGFIILKISRSCLADRVDLRAGEKAYFAAIVALRESSMENDDLSARGAMVLAQLWTSTRVFRRPDGVVDGLTLRIRSRLSMGIVFDCFWWWREEFQGKPNPYRNHGTPTLGLTETSALQQFSDVQFPRNPHPASDQQIFCSQMGAFSDFALSANLDFAMPEDMIFAA